MKYEKKYTAIQIYTSNVNSCIEVNFQYGDVQGAYYDERHPKEEFDTEEEAIAWAYEWDNGARWVVVPVIKFIRE